MRWDVLGYGSMLAFTDILMEPITKLVSINALPIAWMIVPTLGYAINPWIFLRALSVEGIAIMNLVWNLISNVLITGIGIYAFKEVMTPTKWMGIGLSFAAMYFLTCE